MRTCFVVVLPVLQTMRHRKTTGYRMQQSCAASIACFVMLMFRIALGFENQPTSESRCVCRYILAEIGNDGYRVFDPEPQRKRTSSAIFKALGIYNKVRLVAVSRWLP